MIQSIELRLFYQTEYDNNFYHVTCKRFLQDYLQESENSTSLDDEYDYEFLFQSSNDSTAIFHTTCKLLSYSSIVKILNKEIYGMDFDVNDLKHKYSLTLRQKLSLEQDLKLILPLYFPQHSIPESVNSDGNLNSSQSSYGNELSITPTQAYSLVDNQNMQNHTPIQNKLRSFFTTRNIFIL